MGWSGLWWWQHGCPTSAHQFLTKCNVGKCNACGVYAVKWHEHLQVAVLDIVIWTIEHNVLTNGWYSSQQQSPNVSKCDSCHLISLHGHRPLSVAENCLWKAWHVILCMEEILHQLVTIGTMKHCKQWHDSGIDHLPTGAGCDWWRLIDWCRTSTIIKVKRSWTFHSPISSLKATYTWDKPWWTIFAMVKTGTFKKGWWPPIKVFFLNNKYQDGDSPINIYL